MGAHFFHGTLDLRGQFIVGVGQTLKSLELGMSDMTDYEWSIILGNDTQPLLVRDRLSGKCLAAIDINDEAQSITYKNRAYTRDNMAEIFADISKTATAYVKHRAGTGPAPILS